MYFIFYGSEGSGKTTQGKLLAQKLGIPHLVSGDLVRRMAQKDQGIMGDICREALSLGHYVADTEMFVLWKSRLKEPDCQNGWVIDGFPRNITQVNFLEEKLNKYNQDVSKVFYLKVSEDEAIQRLLKRGRRSPDGSLHDDPERIKERLKRYKEKESEVLEFYRQKGILEEINGEKSIEDIHTDILAKVKG
jgi:adenylate kinase